MNDSSDGDQKAAPQSIYPPPLDRLFHAGNARDTLSWHEGQVDYPAEHDLGDPRAVANRCQSQAHRSASVGKGIGAEQTAVGSRPRHLGWKLPQSLSSRRTPPHPPRYETTRA